MVLWSTGINISIQKKKAKKIIAQKRRFNFYPTLMKFMHYKIGSDGNEFIVFSEGLKGKDYESDTYRVSNIIENEF